MTATIWQLAGTAYHDDTALPKFSYYTLPNRIVQYNTGLLEIAKILDLKDTTAKHFSSQNIHQKAIHSV